MSEADEDDLARAAREIVRGASAATRLIADDEILERLLAEGFAERLQAPPEADPCLRVAEVLSRLPDIASFVSLSGDTVYHDPALLSRTYARILDRKSDAAVLLAEEIRSHSRECRRPVPRELFEAPPFNLAPDTLAAVLAALAADPAFRDIASTTTSTGDAYLFSSLYLEHNHAAFLAEQDASCALNP